MTTKDPPTLVPRQREACVEEISKDAMESTQAR